MSNDPWPQYLNGAKLTTHRLHLEIPMTSIAERLQIRQTHPTTTMALPKANDEILMPAVSRGPISKPRVNLHTSVVPGRVRGRRPLANSLRVN